MILLRRYRGAVLTALLLAAFAACGKPARQASNAPQDLALTTTDGVRLEATLYPVAEKAPPGLILVHMLGSNRRAWEPFALRAQRKGCLCIAFDLRGHGESATRNGERISYRTFDTAAWLAAVNDIDAAKQALVDHGANPADIALVGASIGANLVLQYAAGHAEIPAIVMISPGLDYKGVRTEDAVAAYGKRPALLITSEGDSYAASSCTTLKRAASGLCEIRTYPGAAHGAALLDASESALETILVWLQPIIGPSG